jgi:methyl-accepting chemotaxis protein
MKPILFINIEGFKEIQKGFNDIVNQLEEVNENAKNRLELMSDAGYSEKEISDIINMLFGE